MYDRTRSMFTIEPDSVMEDAKQERYRYGNCSSSPYLISPVDFSVGSFATRQALKTMSDCEIMNFHKRSRQGEVFFNPLEITIVETNQSPMPFRFTLSHYAYGCTPSRWYLTSSDVCTGNRSTLRMLSLKGFSAEPTIPSLGSLREQAITKAWSNLDQSDVMALVSLAEAEKSLDTIKSTMTKALKLIKGTRKRALRMVTDALRSRKSRKRLANELADLYLEARYGLRPMYYDVTGIAAAINKFDCKRHDRLTVRGHRSDSGSDTGFEELAPSDWTNASYWYDHTWSETWSAEARAGCLARVDLTAANDWGLGLLGESAWELVPFSFIVDWFLNVGATISSWMPKPNTSVLGSWVTTKVVAHKSGTLGMNFLPGNTGTVRTDIDVSRVVGQYSKTVTTITRTPNPSRPIIPSVLIRLDPLKLLDLGLIAKSLRKEKNGLGFINRYYKTHRF